MRLARVCQCECLSGKDCSLCIRVDDVQEHGERHRSTLDLHERVARCGVRAGELQIDETAVHLDDASQVPENLRCGTLSHLEEAVRLAVSRTRLLRSVLESASHLVLVARAEAALGKHALECGPAVPEQEAGGEVRDDDVNARGERCRRA